MRFDCQDKWIFHRAPVVNHDKFTSIGKLFDLRKNTVDDKFIHESWSWGGNKRYTWSLSVRFYFPCQSLNCLWLSAMDPRLISGERRLVKISRNDSYHTETKTKPSVMRLLTLEEMKRKDVCLDLDIASLLRPNYQIENVCFAKNIPIYNLTRKLCKLISNFLLLFFILLGILGSPKYFKIVTILYLIDFKYLSAFVWQ